jgi:GDPmannose 4,6-dehydratase
MAYWCTVFYREGYGIRASNGILFNYESPRRGKTFVTRTISRAVAKIANGPKKKLFLGGLHEVRNWCYAKAYVEPMWLMLQQGKHSDCIVGASGGATVKEFAEDMVDVDLNTCRSEIEK